MLIISLKSDKLVLVFDKIIVNFISNNLYIYIIFMHRVDFDKYVSLFHTIFI